MIATMVNDTGDTTRLTEGRKSVAKTNTGAISPRRTSLASPKASRASPRGKTTTNVLK